jgi:hypothetical protein
VEAATKELRLPFLATRQTIERLSDQFAVNRVCRARMFGLQHPVELFAVRPADGDTRFTEAWQAYDEALRYFETGQFQKAADSLATIDPKLAEVPSRFLIERTEAELGRQQRRRSSDKPIVYPGGVIAINAK